MVVVLATYRQPIVFTNDSRELFMKQCYTVFFAKKSRERNDILRSMNDWCTKRNQPMQTLDVDLAIKSFTRLDNCLCTVHVFSNNHQCRECSLLFGTFSSLWNQTKNSHSESQEKEWQSATFLEPKLCIKKNRQSIRISSFLPEFSRGIMLILFLFFLDRED